MEQKRKFSHTSSIPEYMRIVVNTVQEYFGDEIRGKKILDIPAGNGWISESLKNAGANTVPADINDERPDYVPANMEKTLPFNDQEFDCVICAEGIEHILRPEALFSELARVLKKDGLLIITTPNVQNFYSRWQLFFTGYLYQFHLFEVPPQPGEMVDRGHISPVFYSQLRYYSEMNGLKTLKPDGDRYKKIIALPFFIPFVMIGYMWAMRDWKKWGREPKGRESIAHIFSMKVLFSRSLIFKAIKK